MGGRGIGGYPELCCPLEPECNVVFDFAEVARSSQLG